MEASATSTDNRQRISVRTKLALALSLCIGLIALFVFFYFPRALERETTKAMASRAQSIGEMTAFSAAPGLLFNDEEAIREALSVAQQNKDLLYLVVTDTSGQVLSAHNVQEAIRVSYKETHDTEVLHNQATAYKSRAPISYEGEELGSLYLGFSLQTMRKEVNQSRTSIAWLSVVLFVIGVGLVVFISTVLIAPLAQITRTADQIAQGGDLALRTQVRSRDEIGRLARSFDHMVDQLEAAYRRLEHQHELEQEIAVRKRTETALRTAKDKAEEMSRLKDTFLANMSHEIRTPLTAIIGLADTLHEEVTKDNQEFTGLIRQSGQRLLDTLNSVLDLAQIESGDMNMKLTALDLKELTHESVNIYRLQAEDQDLYLKTDTLGKPAWVMADHGALSRVLNNLISNAIKFTHTGGITVSVHTCPTEAELRVTDTGIGIDEAFLPHIFDEFRQESHGHARNYEGNGLGLSITKRLLDLMGGSIHVRSIKDLGSQFIITLPLATEQVEPTGRSLQGDGQANEVPVPMDVHPFRSAKPRVVQTSEEPPVSEARVLIIEDTPETARTIEVFLKTYPTALATNPEDALALATSQPFDLLLVDINLRADRTGTDIMRELRQTPAYAKTPMVALTAYAMPGDREQLLKAGFDAYISKPFRKDHLLKAVAHLLRKNGTVKTSVS